MTTLKEFLLRTRQNLQILEERQAKQGSAPELKLLNQIEDHQRAIELLEAALATTPLTEKEFTELKAALRPLLVADNVESLDVDTLKPEKARLPFEPETVLIPAGPFLMGSQPGEDIPVEETPQHEVILPTYRIGRYPVTNAQYAEFIKQNTEQEPPKKAGWSLREPPADKFDHPVVGINWHDAQAYCRWLSQQTGHAYRLPTEAEWEKAAAWAAGEKRIYPWGNDWQAERCNNTGQGTTPVTTYPEGASDYGCYDMAGNAQEWVSTLWGSDLKESDFPYPYQTHDGREDLGAAQRLHGVRHLHRGGSFRDQPANLRCSARGWSDPDSKLRWRSFRVAREV